MKKQTIEEVIAFFGSQVELARLLGVSQQSIRHWVVRGHIPLRRALQIEEVSGGKIRLKDILHLTNKIWRKEGTPKTKDGASPEI